MAVRGRPIQKGQVLNPTGRPPKSVSITDMLRKVAAEEMEINGVKMTKGDFIAAKLFQMAAQGDMNAIKLMVDRIDGAAKQQIEHSGPDGGPVQTSLSVEFLSPGAPAQQEDSQP